MTIKQLSVLELKDLVESSHPPYLIDVREPHEREISSLGGQPIPLNSLAHHINQLDPSIDYVIYCRSGGRSQIAAESLISAGFRSVANLSGGINAWAEQIDTTMQIY